MIDLKLFESYRKSINIKKEVNKTNEPIINNALNKKLNEFNKKICELLEEK